MAASVSGISDILPEHFCWRGRWVAQTAAVSGYYIGGPANAMCQDPVPEGVMPFIRGGPLVVSAMAQKLI